MISWNGIKRFIRFYYLKIIRIRSKPEAIARGVSLGVFFDVMLIFGVGFIIAGLIAPLFKANRVAAVTAGLLTKPIVPFTLVFNTYLGIRLTGLNGKALYGGLTPSEGLSFSFSLGWAAFVGSFIVATILAIGIYPVSIVCIKGYHKRKEKRMLLKAQHRHELFLASYNKAE